MVSNLIDGDKGLLLYCANILGLGQSHPEDQDELEDVVEGCDKVSFCRENCGSSVHTEPVGGADGALNDGQEGKDNPVL